MTKVLYTSPGLTIDEAEKAVASGIDSLEGDGSVAATLLATIDQCITVAGQTACTWQGVPWWWARGTAQFNTRTLTGETEASDRTGNSVTIATGVAAVSAAHYLQAGQYVRVSGTEDDSGDADATFDGLFKVAEIDGTETNEFSYWNEGDNASDITAGTVCIISYPLRAINTAGQTTTTLIAEDLWAVERVYYDDDRPLQQITYRQWRSQARTNPGHGLTTPTQFCIVGEEPQLFLWPPPSDGSVIHIDYIKRHSKIVSATSLDTALLVPAEFRWGIYVAGSQWLMQHETMDPSALSGCPQFVDTMRRMAASDPTKYGGDPADNYPGVSGEYPSDKTVLIEDTSGY